MKQSTKRLLQAAIKETIQQGLANGDISLKDGDVKAVAKSVSEWQSYVQTLRIYLQKHPERMQHFQDEIASELKQKGVTMGYSRTFEQMQPDSPLHAEYTAKRTPAQKDIRTQFERLCDDYSATNGVSFEKAHAALALQANNDPELMAHYRAFKSAVTKEYQANVDAYRATLPDADARRKAALMAQLKDLEHDIAYAMAKTGGTMKDVLDDMRVKQPEQYTLYQALISVKFAKGA